MKRVLIVEDGRTCRDMLSARLARPPCRAAVLCASSLKEARRLVDARPPWDLVVLDLDLPDGNGADLLPLVRCQVVLCTAAPEKAPPGHHVTRKGPRWAANIERIVLGLP